MKSQEPLDLTALLQRADELARQGAFQEAASLLTPLAVTSPTPSVLHLLEEIQFALRDLVACEATLDRFVALAPEQVPPSQYLRLAKLKGMQNKTDEARDVLRQGLAAHGRDFNLLGSYADTLDHADAHDLLERFAVEGGTVNGMVSPIRKRQNMYRAAANRLAQGLPIDRGLSWEDTCTWPDPEGLSRLKQALLREVTGASYQVDSLLDLACVTVLSQRWTRAGRLFDKIRATVKRRTKTFADYAAFGDAFHAELACIGDDDILAALPAPAFQSPATLYLASDLKYFTRFTLQFLRALEAKGIPADAHVHILDCRQSDWHDLRAALAGFNTIRVALSVEDSGATDQGDALAKVYFHAVRFIRFYAELKRTRRPMWLLDADVDLLQDPMPLLQQLDEFDLALQTNPCGFDPASKFKAACVGISPTVRGLDYARRIAAYIFYWKRRGEWWWGIDQVALFSSYAYDASRGEAPRTLFLDTTAVRGLGQTGGVFYFPAGLVKFKLGTG
jgi:hypothetical protein